MRKVVSLNLLLIGLVIFGRNIPHLTRAAGDSQTFLPIITKPIPPRYRIAVKFSPASNDLMLLDSDGTNPTPLLSSGSPNTLPLWSPNARFLAYFAEQNGRTDLYSSDWQGNRPNALTASLNLSNAFFVGTDRAWSPDSTQLAFFTSDTSVNAINDLFVAKIADNTLTNLTQSAGLREAYPDWSPDGEQIVFATRGFANGNTVWSIETIRPNTLTRRTLYGPVANHKLAYPTYAPDGNTIAFIDLEAPFATLGGELVTINQNGNFAQRYPTLFPLQNNLAWSPDGSHLAFVGETDFGGIRVFALRLADGVVMQSLLPADVRSQVTWSADSQQLIFDAPDNDARNLFRYDLASNNTTPLTHAAAGESYAQPAWSPMKLP